MDQPLLKSYFLMLLVVSLSHNVASTLHHAPRSYRKHRRLNPTTCTSIPDGVDAFGKASAEAFSLRDEETDCHVADGPKWQEYPHSIEPSTSELCVTLDSSTRYIFSNGVPDHAILPRQGRPKHCTVRYGVEMPFAPTYDNSYIEENPIAGPLGFAINGVPFVDAAWAMDGDFLLNDTAWAGHANVAHFYWHYHTSRMPPSGDYPEENELVGYAMDGFPIYGPSNHSLDVCNGRLVNGKYRYHMVRMEDIDFSLPQCNANDRRVHNWNPIIGCYRGSTSQSRVFLDDPLDTSSRDGMFCSPPDLATCLRAIPGDALVVAEANIAYTNATKCHNSGRTDRQWSPRAIIRANTADHVAAAVKCATLFDVTVTPRSGAHGFENEACSGELIVDVSGLESLVVDTDTKVIEFGSGHVHGQLYKKLSDFGLVVPGGTENSVGTAGLWLGCGRGPMAQIHGLSCDSVLGVEYVDANGKIQVANSTTNTDMYWMARGSGGEFPGVVTKFIAQAYDIPDKVWAVKITFRSDQIGALLKEWTSRLDELSDPTRSMFTNIHSYMGNPIMAMSCYGCTDAQKEWMNTQFSEIADLAGGGTAYTAWAGTWLDRLLKEDWDEYDNMDDLMVKPEWPAVWAVLANGAHMVPSIDASDEMIAVIQNALETYGDGFFLYIYSMTGSHISSVPGTETAYGGRDAKYVVHYKFIGNEEKAVKFPLRDISIALDEAGLECKGFYNYADREYPCAAESGEQWLEAHFSDVPRMRAIKESEDPHNRFMSEFKAKKWKHDPNKHVFVGWPDVGDWGGTCTCPNGGVYKVGDNSDSCQSLACVGGISGACTSDNPGGAGYKTVCIPPDPTPSPITATVASPAPSSGLVPPTAVPATPATNASTVTPTTAPLLQVPTTTPSIAVTQAPVDPPIIITFSTFAPSASSGLNLGGLSVAFALCTAMVATFA